MTDQNVSKTCWRSLKQMHEYYLAEPRYDEGKSAADLVRSYREQQRLRRSFFQIANALPRAKPKSEIALAAQLNELDEKIKGIENDVKQGMLTDACNGRWVAMGRRNPDADPELIQARHWPFLQLDLDRGVVAGDGLSYYDLRCALSIELPAAMPQHGKKYSPGRPNRVQLVVPEFKRRCENGELAGSLNQEADYLVGWVKATYPTLKPIAASSVKNVLRDQYRAAKSQPTISPK